MALNPSRQPLGIADFHVTHCSQHALVVNSLFLCMLYQLEKLEIH